MAGVSFSNPDPTLLRPIPCGATPRRTGRRAWFTPVLLLWLLPLSLRSTELPPLLGQAESSAVSNALRCLKMSPADLSYKKDYADAPFRLLKVQRFLDQPLELPRHADDVMRAMRKLDSWGALNEFVSEELEVQTFKVAVEGSGQIPGAESLAAIPPRLRETLSRLLSKLDIATAILEDAFADVSVAERQRAFARYAVETFHLKDDPAEVEVLGKMGFDAALMRNMIARNRDFATDDDEFARDLLPVFAKIDRAKLLTATAIVFEAAGDAFEEMQQLSLAGAMPADGIVGIGTKLGLILLGGSGPTRYVENAFLIIDLGGDDIYECGAAGANGLGGLPLSLIIDLDGNDRYRSGSIAQGVGVFGIGVLIDGGEGKDVYKAKHLCQGAGFFGSGALLDTGSDDHYIGDIHAQGVGLFGVGVLLDHDGWDRYQARLSSQGFGYTGGLGLLRDQSGNDVYTAGGKYRDHERLPKRFLSTSQGFGYGMRPDASGGVGILCDLAGNDTYESDVYGQGVSYFYSLGMVLDADGNDLYRCYQYGQGAGIHLSCGILADWQGDDSYLGSNIVQGTAHDWSVGMLFDKQGNDTYIAKTTAQGSALYNSTAMLIDSAGNDTYSAPKGSNTQAAGHDGWTREYGTIALLLDLGGKDTYTNGPRDNYIDLKPMHGCAYDGQVECGRRLSAPTVAVRNEMESRRAEAPPTFVETNRFASTPTEVSRPKNDQERRWFRLIREASQYEDTEQKAKDKYLAYAMLEHDGAKVLPFWLRQCDHDSGMVRIRLEEFVDELGATKAAPALIDALNSPSDLVRRNAAYFIGKLKVENAVEPLLQQLSNEKLRSVSLWALGQVKAEKSFPEAIKYLSDTNEIIRVRATGVLGKLEDRRGIIKLIDVLDAPLWDVRYSAQGALIKIGKPAVKPMLEALPKINDRARPYLIEALGEVGDARTALALRPYLQSLNWLDRGTAVEAIAKLKPAWVRAAFRPLRRSETNEFVRSRLEDAFR